MANLNNTTSALQFDEARSQGTPLTDSEVDEIFREANAI